MFSIVRIGESEQFVPMSDFGPMLEKRIAESGMGKTAFARRIAVSERTLNHYLNGSRQPKVEALPKIARELGVEIGDLFRERSEAIPSTTCANLGSARTFASVGIPVFGWASCGPKGEGRTQRDDDRTLPAPDNLDPSLLFYAIAKGNSMRQEGITSGAFVLVDTARPSEVGERVWFKDVAGMTSLKRLIARDQGGATLRGWMVADAGRMSSFNIVVPPAAIEAMHPVVAVFDRMPRPGESAQVVPDPRADEFGVSRADVDRRIAAALGLRETSSADEIVEAIKDLRTNARGDEQTLDLRRDVDDLYSAISGLKKRLDKQ